MPSPPAPPSPGPEAWTARDVADRFTALAEGWAVNPYSEGMTMVDLTGPDGGSMRVVRSPDGRVEAAGVVPGATHQGFTLRLGFMTRSQESDVPAIAPDQLCTVFARTLAAMLAATPG